MRFRDRIDAGRRVAEAVSDLGVGDDSIVLGLPRGGVPVAAEVARTIGAPFDVLVVRKLGVPGHEELAFGAIASGGIRVLNDDVVRLDRITPDDVERVTASEIAELQRRERVYRGNRPALRVDGRTVVVVDDGLATGATMTAAVDALREARAGRIVVAVPVGAPETVAMLAARADHVICVATPAAFGAVGAWYDDFSPTTDDEVRDALVE